MFAKVRGNRHERSSSGATTTAPSPHVPPPLVSPLQMNFDFELPASHSQSPYRISGESLSRPGTSEGAGNRKSGLSFTSFATAPPVLPPIPRVASRYEPSVSDGPQDSRLSVPGQSSSSSRARDESDNVSAFSFGSRKSQLVHPAPSFEHPIDLMPTTLSRPASDAAFTMPGQEARPSTSGGSTPKMESSLFPPKSAASASGSPMLPPINSGPPMSRAFIDSRDKPYSHRASLSRPTQQLQMQQSQSLPYMSPNMLSMQSPASYTSGYSSSHSPLSPQIPTPSSAATLSPHLLTPSSAASLRAPKISGARLSPSASVEDLRVLHRSPTSGTTATMSRPPTNSTTGTMSPTAPTNYSGSTALPSPHSSLTKPYPPPAHSPLAHTIGTPYGTTSSSFPLPQHVATRPKTAGGATATVAGIHVPTHHTSTARPASGSGSGSTKTSADKRKTRLLNPMALLTRRKSSQDAVAAGSGGANVATLAHERSAAAQAYARQKSVAAVGVSRIPEDFDPRIRGKVVHDFSAPRASPQQQQHRHFSYNLNEAESMLSTAPPPLEERSPASAPFVPALREQLDFSAMFGSGGGGGSGGAGQQPVGADVLASSMHSKNTSESSSASNAAYYNNNSNNNRRSMNSPSMFRELLSDDATDSGSRRESSLNAERLENKGFLQRVSQHSSNVSQESAVLPPFARRSQHFDPLAAQAQQQQGFVGQEDELAGQHGREQRDSSGLSSISEVSPVTGWSSGGGGGNGNGNGNGYGNGHGKGSQTQYVRELRDSLGQSLSPVSPRSPEKRVSRPFSGVASEQPAEPEPRGRSESEATARPFASAVVAAGPGVETIAEHPLPYAREPRAPNRSSAQAPEAVVTQDRESSSSSSLAAAREPSSSSGARSTHRMPSLPIPDRASSLAGLSTPELTPEIAQAESMPLLTMRTSPPARIVEKRASAVGHAARGLASSSTGVPKHQVSNASRFSFQFGESRAEEEALEEKHRRVRGGSAGLGGRRRMGREGEEEEEEEDFDEGAMDDMDEFEQREQEEQAVQVPGLATTTTTTGLLGLQAARRQLQAAPSESDDGSVYDDDDDEIPDVRSERELTYAEHPAFRAHSALASTASHSRDVSQQMGSEWRGSGGEQYGVQQQQQQMGYEPEASAARRYRGRGASDASALTIHTANLPMTGGAIAVATGHNAGNGGAFVQDSLSPNERQVSGGFGAAPPRSGFYMQPKAAGYSPSAGSPLTEKPPLPHRDSGNSERNRTASGMSFTSSAAAEAAGRHERVLSGGVVGGSGVGSTSAASGALAAGGLGLSGLGNYHFSDGPDLSFDGSRPTSRGTAEPGYAYRGTHESGSIPQRMSGWAELDEHGSMGTPPPPGTRKSAGYFGSPESNGYSAAHRGTIGNNIRARNQAVDQDRQYADSESADERGDDMYYDDGGFEQDIKSPHNRHDSVDEDEFDNNAYLQRARMGGLLGHQRDVSARSFASLGGDGPYPSFAMGANPVKPRQRQSQLLLEDLPLQGPVDPKLIPQRNPSEDAKRMGLSNKVPPLPAQEGSKEAMMRMQSNLQAYHAALAEAANQAAAEGRFQRQLSVASTARSLSAYSKGGDDDKSHYSLDDRSHYSRDDQQGEDAGGLAVPKGDDGLSRSASKDTSGSRMDQSHTYSPPKLDFDFGFGAGLMDDGPEEEEEEDDDLGLDDDMVAAANGDVLADDDEGFYGQEFGFYAHARPNSGEVQAINGGFFGEDGDDGLARNKSLKEPNLTPITERSEFSTRNSFVNLGHGGAFGLPSAGLHGPASPAFARLPVSPLVENEATSFDQLRKLRANAFGGSNGSLGSDHGPVKGPGAYGWQAAHHAQSPSLSTKSPAAAQGYFGSTGGTPMTQGFGYGTEGSGGGGSSDPSSARQQQAHQDSPQRQHFYDSPQSAATPASNGGFDPDATPRKQAAPPTTEPVTARKASAPAYVMNGGQAHARKGSDSVTYVKEQDPAGGGQPRWVLERRRTSEQGKLELVGREVVQGGWI
ncbi:hypothetical protein LTR36_002456 [Oleoguttula mirabilis]|uniref:Uncharacterized protein n=1 Tax=Oleoguttula mirabilis TaxID=1507867 RepID=A0AAV9JKZ3_9PEZI|nr:hypothetical protein LTR36_002456 [Oleoguttula mirabilis]